MGAPWGPLGASLGVPGGLRNALGAPQDACWGFVWRKMSSKVLSEAVRARFSSILGAPDLENHSFYLVKRRFFAKSTFPLRERFGEDFGRPGSPFGAPGRPFWLPGRPRGRPGALLGRSRGLFSPPGGHFLEPFGPLFGEPLGNGENLEIRRQYGTF